MSFDATRLAAVLAVSSAFLAACSDRSCHDAQGQAIACSSGGHGGVSAFGGGSGGDQAGAAARGGFGGTGEGAGGDGGGGE